MRPLLTAAQMRRCDQYTIESGTPSRTLMERAARAAIDVLQQHLSLTLRTVIVVLCGSGNNGGDGFAMARFLFEKGYRVTVCYGGAWSNGSPEQSKMSTECATQYALWRSARGKTTDTLPSLSLTDTVLIDALLGIGLDRPVGGKLAEWIETVNASGLPVLSVDIPSGIDADTGKVLGCAVQARVTATMAYPKRGLLLYPGAAHVGKLCVCDIGIGLDALLDSNSPDLFEITAEDLIPRLPRPAYANKGTFGRVLVIGGDSGMCGAPYFAAKTAYRAGAGLCEVMTHPDNRSVIQTLLPEAVFSAWTTDKLALSAALTRADSVVLGCGLGQSAEALSLVEQVLRLCHKPLVLDADALNLLAVHEPLRALLAACEAPTVLTPHLGEAARLCGLVVKEIADDLVSVAHDLATRLHAVCVLKDARTVISDGAVCYLQRHGNSGMATGGSGDCLAGLIGSLLAQHRDRTDTSAALLAANGVLLHALAGDTAAQRLGEHAVMASDIADAVGEVLRVTAEPSGSKEEQLETRRSV